MRYEEVESLISEALEAIYNVAAGVGNLDAIVHLQKASIHLAEARGAVEEEGRRMDEMRDFIWDIYNGNR